MLRLLADGVEDAFAGVELLNLGGDLLGVALEKELLEDFGRFVFRRNGDAGARPREAAAAGIYTEGDRREAGERADLLGDLLIERDGVAEGAAAGVRRGREKADVGGVAAIDVGMRDTAEDGEVLAVFLEVLQIGRGGVVAAGFFREEEVCQQAEIIADAEEAAGLFGIGGWLRVGGTETRHRFQQG